MKKTVWPLCGVLAGASTPALADEADPWLARDKYLHGSVSAALALGGYAGAAVFTESRPWRLAGAGALALTVGAGKETLDLMGAGDASWRDMSWNVLGVATGLLVAWAIDTYVF